MALPDTDTDKRRLRHAFEAIVGRDAVLTDPHDLLVYESDGLTVLIVELPDRAYAADERA